MFTRFDEREGSARSRIEAELAGDRGRGPRDSLRQYLNEIGRETLLTPAEEFAIASRLGAAAHEARIAAHTLPEMLESTLRGLPKGISMIGRTDRKQIETVLESRLQETATAWRSFRNGELSESGYLAVLRHNAESLERGLIRRTSDALEEGQEGEGAARAYSLIERNLARAREIGGELRRIVALSGPASAEIRQWEEDHRIPAPLAAALSDRVASIQDEVAPERERFIRSNLRLVVPLAKQHLNPSRDLLDLISLGNEGLIRAIDRFDAAEGTRLSTYATLWIHQAIRRGTMDSNSGVIHVPRYVQVAVMEIERSAVARSVAEGAPVRPEEIAAERGWSDKMRRNLLGAPRAQASLDAPVGVSEQSESLGATVSAPERSGGREYARGQLERIIARLPNLLDERQRTIVAMVHGIKLDEKLLVPGASPEEGPHTLKDTGRILGVTRERTRQILMDSQNIFAHAAVLDSCTERIVRHAERALQPGEALLVRTALDPSAEGLPGLVDNPRVKALEAASRQYNLDPEAKIYRLMQLGLERLVEQVAVDRLSPERRGALLARLAGVERAFFEACWLRPTPSLAVIAGELGRPESGLVRIREDLRQRILRPLVEGLIRDSMRE